LPPIAIQGLCVTQRCTSKPAEYLCPVAVPVTDTTNRMMKWNDCIVHELLKLAAIGLWYLTLPRKPSTNPASALYGYCGISPCQESHPLTRQAPFMDHSIIFFFKTCFKFHLYKCFDSHGPSSNHGIPQCSSVPNNCGSLYKLRAKLRYLFGFSNM
jgi:hypothetical protein